MPSTPRLLAFAFRNGRNWFCVAGVQCVATYPEAAKIIEEIRS
jgi:hypothetical protein